MIFQRRPALRFVILFSAGIVFAKWVNIFPIWIYFITFVFVLAAGIFIRMNKYKIVSDFALSCSVILLGFLCQSLQHSDFKSRELDPRITDESVLLFGTIDSAPTHRDRKVHCIIRTDSIIRENNFERKSRRVMVMIRLEKGESLPEGFEFGTRVQLQGTIEPFPFQRNPGEFDYGKYLALNDVQGVVSIMGTKEIYLSKKNDVNSLRARTYSAQCALYRIIDALHAPRHASFLKGIVFGYSAEIPNDVKQSFLDTGTIHILAVSGSNVAFVAFMFFSIMGFFRIPRKAVGGITLIGLIVYMIITGASPSVVRATIMAIVIMSGTFFERKADIYNSISVAAMILLLWDTNTLFNVGFQLSFSAVLSIVFFYPKLEQLIRKIPERFEEIKAIEMTLKLFAVSLAAQIGTIPFTAYYFGRVSIISLIANIPVVPISGLNTFVGFAEVLFSFISPWVANCYAATNDFLIWFLLGFVKQAASVSFAYVEIWQVTVLLVTGYYVFILGIFHLHHAWVRRWMLIYCLIVGNIFLYSDLWSYLHLKLNATIIDVGQGDAILLECPNGKRVLIDSGPSSNRFDAGERTIIPFLKRKGLTRIDYFILTHPHSDHIGGASSILQSIHVDTLVMDLSVNRQATECLSLARMRNTGIKQIYAGSQIQVDQNVRLYVLSPQNNCPGDKNINNSSIVIKVLFGNSSFLLMGDAETVIEKKLVQMYGEFLSSMVLKIGHHGSLSSTSEEFINIVRPQKALISVGNHNKFRHPSPWIMKRLSGRSVEVLRTDRQGAIIFESEGRQWEQKE